MKTKLAIAAFLVFGVVALRYAYVRGYPPFTSQTVQTCEKAVQQRLAVPSTYQRIGVDESQEDTHVRRVFYRPDASRA